MITYPQARELLLNAATLVTKPVLETCKLVDLPGRISAAPITASANLPAFDNSAMDGFTLKAIAAAGPVQLPVLQQILAGQSVGDQPSHGAVQIMTGAPVPKWCETVVPIENVEAKQNADGQVVSIELTGPVPTDRHIRRAGEDVQIGEELIAAGRIFTPEDIMMLAALGLDEVQVLARPKITLISTGAELVDDPAKSLQPGQIRNSNQPYLAALLNNWPVEINPLSGHPDDAKSFLALMDQARDGQAQIIISTGAVSMGVRDFVPAALSALGATTIFHKCRIRPGKPVLFAKLPDGTLFFGLPGNPVSAAVGLHFFVMPVLRKILMQSERPIRHAQLSKDFSKRAGLTMFAKARVTSRDAKMQIEVLSGQESFRIKPLLQANCWAELPQDASDLAAGSLVRFHPFTEGLV
ncbi:MAG: molybdopterin molybdenumtransferase MoeA [Robiginitomaculum sp.]|nr:MAG: molybdopterin molybdenumtransferase MoeA [Robiginitomaculum sp.]